MEKSTPKTTSKPKTKIELRVTPEEKKRYMAEAKTRGVTLTELVLSRLRNQALPDKVFEKTMFETLLPFGKAFGSVGNNINQLMVAIHQINHSQKMETGEFQKMLEAIKEFQAMQVAFNKTLMEVQFIKT